ncbi:MBG domain-containing protein, partial [Fulvivirga aurantia]
MNTSQHTNAPVEVTADNQEKIYGETDPTLSYQITSGSLVGDDTFSDKV